MSKWWRAGCASSLAIGCSGYGWAFDEIIVEAQPPRETLPAAIGIVRPRDLSDAVSVLPGATLSLNSRGETLVSIRGRSEREIAVVLDGVPLSDPWDGRLDLALLPPSIASDTRLIPEGDATSGSGGALVMKTTFTDQNSLLTEGGDFGYGRLSARTGSEGVATSYLVAIDHVRRDGYSTSGASDLPFSQNDNRTRTNTDRTQTSLFTKAERAIGNGTLNATLLTSSASYGVAPEGHIDPAEDSVRFWRIPDDRRTIGAVQLEQPLACGDFEISTWFNAAQQSIKQFTGVSYAEEGGGERSRDRAIGGQAVWLKNGIEAGFSAVHARHEEREDSAPQDAFSRMTLAGWAKAEKRFTERQGFAAGVRVESFKTGDSGGRPEAPDLSVVTGQIKATRRIGRSLTVDLLAARLARLPTQRELYGQALNRFLVNPGLEPETAWMTSVRIQSVMPNIRFAIEPFLEVRDGVIGQRIVQTPGGARRQRVNQGRFESVGADFTLSARLAPGLVFDTTVNLLDLDGEEATAYERPDAAAFAALSYRDPSGLGGLVSVRHRGNAFSLAEDGGDVRLDPATGIDAEISYKSERWEAFARVENATDADFLPQLGLPGPGRQFRLGVRARI